VERPGQNLTCRRVHDHMCVFGRTVALGHRPNGVMSTVAAPAIRDHPRTCPMPRAARRFTADAINRIRWAAPQERLPWIVPKMARSPERASGRPTQAQSEEVSCVARRISRFPLRVPQQGGRPGNGKEAS